MCAVTVIGKCTEIMCFACGYYIPAICAHLFMAGYIMLGINITSTVLSICCLAHRAFCCMCAVIVTHKSAKIMVFCFLISTY